MRRSPQKLALRLDFTALTIHTASAKRFPTVSDPSAPVLNSFPNTAIWLVRESARPLAEKLGDFLEALVLPDATSAMGGGPSNRERFVAAFPSAKQWVMLMASGIATRYLAGLPHDKNSDPAVVVLDEACRFAIPLLCGHEGGANALAYRIAAKTGAENFDRTSNRYRINFICLRRKLRTDKS